MLDYYLLMWAVEMTKWHLNGCCYLWPCFSSLQVMDNTEIHVVPNILMMVGLASIGTDWFASRVCQDSLDASRFPRWKMLLMAWFAVAVLLCYLLITVVVLSYALQGRLEESLKVGHWWNGSVSQSVWCCSEEINPLKLYDAYRNYRWLFKGSNKNQKKPNQAVTNQNNCQIRCKNNRFSLFFHFQVGLRNGIRFYKDTDVPGRCFQKETIDRLQMEFRCCGNSNFKDWFEVQWVNNRYLDFTTKDVKE